MPLVKRKQTCFDPSVSLCSRLRTGVTLGNYANYSFSHFGSLRCTCKIKATSWSPFMYTWGWGPTIHVEVWDWCSLPFFANLLFLFYTTALSFARKKMALSLSIRNLDVYHTCVKMWHVFCWHLATNVASLCWLRYVAIILVLPQFCGKKNSHLIKVRHKLIKKSAYMICGLDS